MLVSKGEHLVLKSYLKDLGQKRGFTLFFFFNWRNHTCPLGCWNDNAFSVWKRHFYGLRVFTWDPSNFYPYLPLEILWLILSSNLTPWCRPVLESSKYWSFWLSWLLCLHWERDLTFHFIFASVLSVMFLILFGRCFFAFCLGWFVGFFNQGTGTDSAWETAVISHVFWNSINYSSCKELI